MTHSSIPRALILDCDGVILESADIKTQAFAQVFSGYPEHVEEIVRHHLDNVGLSRFEKFRHAYASIIGEELTPGVSEQLGRRFAEIVAVPMRTCPEVEGASAFLSVFSKRCLLFVASGTPEAELRLLMRDRGLDRFFEGVFGSPATKDLIIARILREWALEPTEALFVGDAITDLRHAVQARIPFVGRERASDPVFAQFDDKPGRGSGARRTAGGTDACQGPNLPLASWVNRPGSGPRSPAVVRSPV